MSRVRTAAAWLLALAFVVFGLNGFLGFIPDPPDDGSVGYGVLMEMREGGLMTWIALSHVVVGVLLVLPRTRFAAGLMQLTLTLGILAYHATLMPGGLGPAVILLLLNLAVIADRERFAALLR